MVRAVSDLVRQPAACVDKGVERARARCGLVEVLEVKEWPHLITAVMPVMSGKGGGGGS